jgi:5-formaminoimidazole-4-carboxamide-1-beta-D-ribofuranosyl 5'-monophosphate synthetase
MRVFQHGWTTEQLEALGITRPYEPQVGDVVRLTDKEAIRQDRRHFYAVSGIASGIESSQVQLWDARGTVVTWVKPSDLVFVARPEAKP